MGAAATMEAAITASIIMLTIIMAITITTIITTLIMAGTITRSRPVGMAIIRTPGTMGTAIGGLPARSARPLGGWECRHLTRRLTLIRPLYRPF